MGRRTTNLPRHVRRHHDGYRAVFQVDGQTITSPKLATAEAAAEWVARYRAQGRGSGPATLQAGFDALLDRLAESGAQQGTVDYYRKQFATITKPDGWGVDLPLHRITADQARRYARARLASGVATSTVWHKELQALDRILSLAVERGHLPTNPLRSIRRPKLRQRRFDYLTMDRIGQLCERMESWPRARTGGRDADLCRLLALTGLRRSELARLQVEDVDFDSEVLWVRGKNDGRSIPIAGEARPVLSRLVAGVPAGATVGRTAKSIEQLFRRWRQRLDERRWSPHCFRHSYAVAMVRAGVHPFTLQRLMGHAKPDQTMRYFHEQDDLSRAAVAALSLRTPGEDHP